MSLRLFTAMGSAALVEVDALGVDTDLGAAFATQLDGHPLIPKASGEYKLRRIVQWVTLNADAVVAVTPVADGVVLTEQRYAVALRLADGQAQRLEVPCSARGRRFAARLEVVSGLVAWGEAEMLTLPKRSLTGGDA